MTTETRTVTILGRDMEVTQVNETQYMLLGREAKRVQALVKDEKVAPEDVQSVLAAMARVLNILETRVVNEDDREFLVDKMSVGELSIFDVIPIIRAFYDDVEGQPAKPKVTRGRPVRRK